MADKEDYLIPCEGGDCPAAGGVICAMCGHPYPIVDGVVLAHQRRDVIRMLLDGRFDRKTR